MCIMATCLMQYGGFEDKKGDYYIMKNEVLE